MNDFKGFMYKELGKAYMVSDATADEIKRDLMMNREINTGGKVLEPLYADPTNEELRKGGLRRPAMVIRDGCTMAVRWYWRQYEHKNTHYKCHLLGDGLCVRKCPRYYVWDYDNKKWVLEPMINRYEGKIEE